MRGSWTPGPRPKHPRKQSISTTLSTAELQDSFNPDTNSPEQRTLRWEKTDTGLQAVLVRDGRRIDVAWAPQPGSQVAFLSCPITECLYEGTRGPGKSDALLMDFLQHVGKGYGAEWNGVLFRRTYPELQDVIEKSKKWFPRIVPSARYNESSHVWTFPQGEILSFRHFWDKRDYWSYHGHSYTWIAWEELTTWPDSSCLTAMISCLRSTVPGIPLKIRSTTNPYGRGHNWVKKRYRLPIARGFVGRVIRDSMDANGEPEPERVAVHGSIEENRVLLFADPDYISRIVAAASSPAQLRAWRYGDWNIVAGGMFDDLWDPKIHVLQNFPVRLVPKVWRLDRSYDHGSAKPFSTGWWAESNGEPFEFRGRVYGPVRGDLIRVAEWYGCSVREENVGLKLTSSDIAKGIRERDADYGISDRVRPGPADTAIWDAEPGAVSVEADMRAGGVLWTRADKGPGSRKQGWEQIRKRLKAANTFPREGPGLFVLERCEAFIRTVPTLARSEKDPDDVDEESEDHTGDETRYRLRQSQKGVSSGSLK